VRYLGAGARLLIALNVRRRIFINYAIFEGKPVKLLQDRCYVTGIGGSGNDTGSRVLD